MDSRLLDLLADCETATGTYLEEAGKTSLMLGRCTRLPLSFEERLAIFSQEIHERNAFLSYVAAKRSLYDAARLG